MPDVEKKRIVQKRKRKIKNFINSSEINQQRQKKELLQTANTLAGSETSLRELVDNTFNVNKTEDNILSENILSTMQVLQKHFHPVECKSIGCLLTDNISLDRA